MRRLISLIGCCLLSSLALAGCELESLRISIIPKTDGQTQLQEYQPLLDQLQQRLGIAVEWVPVSSYDSAIDAIVSGGVDVAWLGPASYAVARQRDPRIEPFASLTIREGHFTPAGNHYQSLLLVRADRIDRLSQLQGKKLALVDPASTSGALVPNSEFAAQIQQPLASFFARVVYAGSHDKALDELLSGRIDAAFVASVRADAYLKRGLLKKGELRVLWRSAPIYYDPYVFAGHLCGESKALIRSAFLDDQRGLADFLQAQDASALVPVSHEQYAPLLALLRTLK